MGIWIWAFSIRMKIFLLYLFFWNRFLVNTIFTEFHLSPLIQSPQTTSTYLFSALKILLEIQDVSQKSFYRLIRWPFLLLCIHLRPCFCESPCIQYQAVPWRSFTSKSGYHSPGQKLQELKLEMKYRLIYQLEIQLLQLALSLCKRYIPCLKVSISSSEFLPTLLF